MVLKSFVLFSGSSVRAVEAVCCLDAMRLWQVCFPQSVEAVTLEPHPKRHHLCLT